MSAANENRSDEGNWFARQRQEWIAETLRVFGFINREHIERKFGISTPQASMDLRQYQNERPATIFYNKSSKQYEPVPAGHDLCNSCGRLFKWGDTCGRGGCPVGGDF